MEQTAELQINLFREQLPSLEELRVLSHLVHASEANRMRFAEQVQQNVSSNAAMTSLQTGIGLFILGRNREALAKLQKGPDCKEKYLYLAFTLRQLRKHDEAIQNLQRAKDHGAEALSVSLEKTATYRSAGNLEAAAKEIKSCANFQNVSAEYHYQLARLEEAQGLYDNAVANYKTALELAPTHHRAMFHLAYRYDLSGYEDQAIEHYKQVVSGSPTYVSALLNLAVLYEDLGDFDKASACIDKVLESHPNHPRASLFHKDVESSKTMLYDEEREKKRSRKNQILETPISDFELSVRSRNCLRKMNIRTLGDLLNITEAELLSYKNFGETSLREIKAILDQKGLRLGQALEDKQLQVETTPERAATDDRGLMNKTVEDIQLSVRARKCLQKLNIRTLGELTRTTDAELLGCKNFGVTSLNEIKKALAGFGLSLRNLD
ncbi:MAG TPA: DNA-directed RNA polymerase subunit alpha C-terminal domain-containing protein [Sedimentisphaerales bacterium]|jgi:DNA-directed RNA polymerase subunit alpha|nr:DNA-directed RNA polymerase subunit alpha C-terminal domain-containing protein [Sedimentisphaerales bacterium]HNU30865.1 DNA-directed RNA polymerase subunit alpha C-terminal domain-containing protein [Sedimentisphaerales bacterium]